jgi:hypothetical protein
MSAPGSASGGRGAPARRSAQYRGPTAAMGSVSPGQGPLFRALRTCANNVMRPGWTLAGREGDCRARRLTITRTMAVGMDAPDLDGWTPTRILGRTAAQGGLSRSSFVLPGQPHGWTTADDPRNASGHAVGRGGRPPWCPLAPSSRPSKVSILDGCPGGCPSGCPAVRSGASIPTASPAWKVRENRMSGRWRSARRPLAPTTRPWPLSAATSRSCFQALKDAPPRVYRVL